MCDKTRVLNSAIYQPFVIRAMGVSNRWGLRKRHQDECKHTDQYPLRPLRMMVPTFDLCRFYFFTI